MFFILQLLLFDFLLGLFQKLAFCVALRPSRSNSLRLCGFLSLLLHPLALEFCLSHFFHSLFVFSDDSRGFSVLFSFFLLYVFISIFKFLRRLVLGRRLVVLENDFPLGRFLLRRKFLIWGRCRCWCFPLERFLVVFIVVAAVKGIRRRSFWFRKLYIIFFICRRFFSAACYSTFMFLILRALTAWRRSQNIFSRLFQLIHLSFQVPNQLFLLCP